MTTITLGVQLTQINCGGCGGTYAINETYRQTKYDEGGSWTCPYCKCGWGYQESQLEKAQKQLAREKAAHDQTRASRNALGDEKRKVERRLIAAKGQITKVKNRIGRGICPCCSYEFKNLEQHMAAEHPDFHKETDGDDGDSESPETESPATEVATTEAIDAK